MKRTLRSGIGLLALAGLLATAAAAQSLGEYARQQRAQKPATPAGAKVYTNDNLPTSGGLSEVGRLEPPPPPPLSPRAAAAEQRAVQKKAEEQKSLEVEWRAKFTEQKKNIAQMQRQLDLFVRENLLRQAAYSANTAERLQHAPQFAEADQRYQAEITEKQQALDEAKQKLENMKDELRKADLPGSWAE
jgi:DNA repair exonuclease SbcCD ATPase subunit